MQQAVMIDVVCCLLTIMMQYSKCHHTHDSPISISFSLPGTCPGKLFAVHFTSYFVPGIYMYIYYVPYIVGSLSRILCGLWQRCVARIFILVANERSSTRVSSRVTDGRDVGIA